MFKQILLGTALAFFISPALADGPNYNFIDIGYQEAELDGDLAGFSVDGDGYGIRGSFEVGENWFVAVAYSSIGFDFGVDLDQIAVGGGYHFGMSERTDFFATLSYLNAKASARGFESVDEDGYGVALGIRSMLTDSFELNGSIGYADLGDGADGTSFNAGALYSFTENFAIGFDIGVDEDVTLYGIGARFYFGS